MLLEVLEGLWQYLVSMVVTIPLDNTLAIIYTFANFFLLFFGTSL